MSGDPYDKYRIKSVGVGSSPSTLKERILARKKPIIITTLLVAGMAFAAGWNPPTTTVHTFTEASDYSARREGGCTNSGEGCHGDDPDHQDFNLYHPETDCKVCHEYTGVGCIPCHAPAQHECVGCHDGSMEGASDCVRLTDSYPNGHYRETLHEAVGTDTSQTVLAAVGGTASATCGDCHSSDLRAAHTGVLDEDETDNAPDLGCAECHNDEQSGALKQVQTDWKQHRCEDCHGEDARAPMHDAKIATAVEPTGDGGCSATGEGCHQNDDLHALHPDAPETCGGSAAEGEPGCHDMEIESHEPTVTACGPGEGTCHAPYKTDGYGHKHDTELHTATEQGGVLLSDALSRVSITCGVCHQMDIVSEHARGHVGLGKDACMECHNKDETTIRAVLDSWPERETTEACATCHDGMHDAIGTVHRAKQAGCVTAGCHGTSDVRVLHKKVGCAIAGCHSRSGAIAGSRMTCGGTGGAACHTGSDLNAIHSSPHGDASGSTSGACTACHGSTVVTANPGHTGCSCHTYAARSAGDIRDAIASGSGECADCHKSGDAPHSFAPSAGTKLVSGHNTTTYDVNGGAEHFGVGGIVVKDSFGDTIEQHWPRPTAGVFWSQTVAVYDDGTTRPITTADFTGSLNPTDSPTVAMGNRTNGRGQTKDLSGAIRTDVGWNSVITCFDCHTGLKGLVGPQGANAASYGLDPNFPDDWTRAELTSFDPTGMRSIETKQSSPNKYYQKWGSQQNWTNPALVATLIKGDPTTTANIPIGGNYNATGVAANGYSAGNVEGAFLCQKCHKLVNSYQGLAIEGNGSGFRSNNLANIGYSNYPHMEHHGDQIQGQGNCVSCHIAIPHGWKRPRLLVYGSDPAPYKTQWVYSYYQIKGTALDQPGTANDRKADLGAAITPEDFGYGLQTRQGNWGFLGANSLTNTYGKIGATVEVTGTVPVAPSYAGSPNNAGKWPVLLTAHLDGISAGVDSHKAIENPSVDEGRLNEAAFNAQPAVVAAGLQMTWSKWAWEPHGDFGGVEWHTDMTPGANGTYNPVPEDNTQHYNNCNGCTSANSGRHTPHNSGINPEVPSWE